jgi:hypothetical protein
MYYDGKKNMAKTSPNLGDLLNTTLMFYILCGGTTQLIMFLFLFSMGKCTTSVRLTN